MNEILEQIYRSNRGKLNYPETVDYLNKNYRKIRGETLNRHEKKNLQYITRLQKKSLQLHKRQRNPQPRLMRNSIHYSAQQKQTLKKYKSDFQSTDKQSSMLPNIKSHRSSSQNSETKEIYQSSRNLSDFSSNRYMVRTKKRLTRDPVRIRANMKKFKKCLHAILFINRVQRLWKNKLQKIKTITNLSNNLLDSINKLINRHYADVMKFQLINFRNIMKSKIVKPEADMTERVVINLVQITNKLKQTNIRKDLLVFLSLVTLQRSPLPVDFFTEYQILRLQFFRVCFQLKNMNEARIKMIVGVFMGVKLLSDYLFKRPWDIEILEVTEKAKQKIEGILWAYSSYINCAILSYFKKLPKHDKQFLTRLKQKGVKPIKNTKVNDEFFNGVLLNYRKQYHKINANLISWINRIAHQVQKWQQENY